MSKKLTREGGGKSVTEKRLGSKKKGVKKAKDQISTRNRRSCNELYNSLFRENCVFCISMEVSLSFPRKKNVLSLSQILIFLLYSITQNQLPFLKKMIPPR